MIAACCLVFYSLAISAGLGAADPSVWNGSTSVSYNTKQSGKSQSQQSVSKSSNSWLSTISNTNYANPSFLSFVGKPELRVYFTADGQ